MNAFPGFVVPSNARIVFDTLVHILGWGAVGVWMLRSLSRWLAAGWTDAEARWWRKGLFFGLSLGVIFIVVCVPATDWVISRIGNVETIRRSAMDPRFGHFPTFFAMTSGLWGMLVLGITQFRRHPDWPALNCRTRICIGMGIGLGTGLAEAALAHLFGGREPDQLLFHLLGLGMDTVGSGVAAMFISPLREKDLWKLFLGPLWKTMPIAMLCLLTYGVFVIPGGLGVLIVGAVLLFRCLQDVDLP